MGSKHSVIKGTDSDYKKKLMHKIFEERLDENIINRPAIYYHDDAVDGVRVTSFNELNKKANRLAACILNMLRKQDADRNDDGDYVIAVCMTTNHDVIAALLAIWKTGSAYLPLEPNFPPNRIEHIVNEAKPALVICDHDSDRTLFHANSMSFNELLTQSSNCSEDDIHTQHSVSRSEDDVAVILYTSGSTGTPKGNNLLSVASHVDRRYLKFTSQVCVFRILLCSTNYAGWKQSFQIQRPKMLAL